LEKIKKYLKFESAFWIILILGLVGLRGPQFIKNWNLQGETTPALENLFDIAGNKISLTSPYALVFWATWCNPCDLELGRIDMLIKDSKLDAMRIIAVSTDDNFQVVAETAKSRAYTFPVHWDEGGVLSKKFAVAGTPTIVVVGSDQKIVWATTGISPSLELRLQQYLKPGSNAKAVYFRASRN
jgi:cytochrome c biogenesis protein CcmG/thiol:disulfide interchange protein DsbE